MFGSLKYSERTAGEAAKWQEASHDVTQEVEVSQQVGAVGASLGEYGTTLPVWRAQFGIADVADVHQEVKDVPQSTSWKSEVTGHLLFTFENTDLYFSVLLRGPPPRTRLS